jgi:hypothetical protein
MKRGFLSLGSARFRRARVGILPTWLCSARCRTLHAKCVRYRERVTLGAKLALIPLVTLCPHASHAVTLETVLQTTLEKNPAIQEAKAGLEQATGKRLVFRSIVWPHAEVGVPAGVQAGHRAGESGV